MGRNKSVGMLEKPKDKLLTVCYSCNNFFNASAYLNRKYFYYRKLCETCIRKRKRKNPRFKENNRLSVIKYRERHKRWLKLYRKFREAGVEKKEAKQVAKEAADKNETHR